MSAGGWIGVDLDGTLAEYSGWNGIGHIGAPVPAMVERVKAWLKDGVEVRIFTARAGDYEHWKWAREKGLLNDPEYCEAFAQVDAIYNAIIKPIESWCELHFGQQLRVTAMKDFGMIELWDDRAVSVQMNTGKDLRS